MARRRRPRHRAADRGLAAGSAAIAGPTAPGPASEVVAPGAILPPMIEPLFRTSAHTALRLAGGRSFRRRVGDAELLCWRFGPADGEPWVMLHGLASTALAWRPVVRNLARTGCRLLVPELSELGGSRCPEGGLAVADGAVAVAELIEEELDGGPVTLAGNSLGGWVAVRLALDRPELVSRLVLVDAGGYRDQDWERIAELTSVTEPEDVAPLYDALFVRVPLPLAVPLGRRAFFFTYSSPAVRSVLARIRPGDAYGDPELARLAQPAALIWGEHDGLFTFATAERMAAALPRARLYRLSGCGHAVQWERPEALADAVADFRGATAPAAAATHAPA